MDERENAFAYKELYESGAEGIRRGAKNYRDERMNRFTRIMPPPDLWNRHSDTGKSTAEIFSEQGNTACSGPVTTGCRAGNNLKEWLKPYEVSNEANKQMIQDNKGAGRAFENF